MVDALPTLSRERRLQIADYLAVDMMGDVQRTSLKGLSKVDGVDAKWHHLFTNRRRGIVEDSRNHPTQVRYRHQGVGDDISWNVNLTETPETGITVEELTAFFAEAGITLVDIKKREDDWRAAAVARGDLMFLPQPQIEGLGDTHAKLKISAKTPTCNPTQVWLSFAQTQRVDDYVNKILSERRRRVAEYLSCDVYPSPEILSASLADLKSKAPAELAHLFDPRRSGRKTEVSVDTNQRRFRQVATDRGRPVQWDIRLSDIPGADLTEESMRDFLYVAGVEEGQYELKSMTGEAARRMLQSLDQRQAFNYQMFMGFDELRQIDDCVRQTLSEEQGPPGGGEPKLYRRTRRGSRQGGR